ncbi:hypothetical protein PPGU16_17960 [Paraburkholderia largidicola]|uniref:HEPN domain-containing protein n=2 Tax=Paraburkholderia largidicola TaxID=3014751 RepID=A0A7I8BK94_9BURK|nr:hypothetical protein PPGU16_17960 [Paraburkholderia sp. PGU16]
MGIYGALRECAAIFATGVLEKGAAPTVIFHAAFAYALACLSDGVHRLKNAGKPITFADDVQVTKKITDVSVLLNECRNAACHINSGLHEVDTTRLYLPPVFGKCEEFVDVKGTLIGASDYEDDCAVFYGSMRIYRDRHVKRALIEASAGLEEL